MQCDTSPGACAIPGCVKTFLTVLQEWQQQIQAGGKFKGCCFWSCVITILGEGAQGKVNRELSTEIAEKIFVS